MTTTVLNYIDNLPLIDVARGKSPFADLEADLGPMRSAEAGGGAGLAPPVPEDLQAAVDTGSILSFVDGVSGTEKDDVLYSVQLAQRGASGVFDRFTQTEAWYSKYTEILETIGWAGEQFAFARYDQSQGQLHMDQAALSIISAIATQNQLAVLQEALGALKSLAEGDGPMKLFDFHTSAEASGNFQMGAVQKSDNGALSLALGGFHFKANDNRRRFLFFGWGKQDVEFWTGARKLTLNERLYADHRDKVRQKLGAAAADFIEGLTLG
jgi:hypothetical protein